RINHVDIAVQSTEHIAGLLDTRNDSFVVNDLLGGQTVVHPANQIRGGPIFGLFFRHGIVQAEFHAGEVAARRLPGEVQLEFFVGAFVVHTIVGGDACAQVLHILAAHFGLDGGFVFVLIAGNAARGSKDVAGAIQKL